MVEVFVSAEFPSTFFAFDSPFAEVSIIQTTPPTNTVSPSATIILMVPLSSAGSSKVALSESNSAID